MDGANMNAQVGLSPPGRHRRRRLPPQPAQDLLHPARRRRPGHGPDRRRRAPRAVPARPPGRPALGGAAGASAPVSAAPWGSAEHPADLLGLHRADGRRRASRRPPRSRSSTPTTSRSGSSRTTRSSTRARTGRVAHEFILDLRPFKKTRGRRGRGHRQAADGLRLPRADDVVPGRRHADDRADRERVEGRARPLLRRA